MVSLRPFLKPAYLEWPYCKRPNLGNMSQNQILNHLRAIESKPGRRREEKKEKSELRGMNVGWMMAVRMRTSSVVAPITCSLHDCGRMTERAEGGEGRGGWHSDTYMDVTRLHWQSHTNACSIFTQYHSESTVFWLNNPWFG